MLRPLQSSGLLARWRDARAETDALFEIVRREFLFERPISERHRIAFYVGHLEAFEWNLLAQPLGLVGETPDLDRLFAFGIDPVEGELPHDQPEDWPALAEFHAYRKRVRERLDEAFANLHYDAHEAQPLDRLLNVAIEHRLMHAETLSYLIHQMPFERKRGGHSVALNQASSASPQSDSVTIPAGRTTLGARTAQVGFGWDNEFEGFDEDVPAFAIDRFKISNAQYLRFVEDGGYANRALWKDDDWAWKTANNIAHPAFWIRKDGAWFWKSMFAALPLPLAWPVYVSHAEASAYAKWAGRALPTEAQWQRAAFADSSNASDPFEQAQTGHVRMRDGFDPLAVDSTDLLPASLFGVVGMRGNGWEWTSSVFAPFAGFRIFDFYPGYSAPFFDGKHFVLKGGSVCTAATMLRPSFRNWFQAHYQYVYAGFRCVDSTQGSAT